MAWTEWNDEPTTGYVGLKCFHCKKAIAVGAEATLRRGVFDGKAGMIVSLHAGACTRADLAFAAGSDDEADSAVADNAELDSDAAESAPAEPAASGASPEQAKKLAHYAEIRRRNDLELIKYSEWDAAHTFAAQLKKELEAMRKENSLYIRSGNDPQRPLEFPDDGGDDDQPSPTPDQPAWKARPLSELMLTKAMTERLAEAGITTLGHLKDFWEAGKVLTAIKGIGPQANQDIADAWGEYAKTHQEVYGMSGDDDADDVDPFAGDEPAAQSDDDDGPDSDDDHED